MKINDCILTLYFIRSIFVSALLAACSKVLTLKNSLIFQARLRPKALQQKPGATLRVINFITKALSGRKQNKLGKVELISLILTPKFTLYIIKCNFKKSPSLFTRFPSLVVLIKKELGNEER